MSLNIHVSYDTPAACRLVLNGRLDNNTAPSLNSLIDDIIDGQFSVLVFDLGGVEFISHEALTILFKGSLQIQARGGKAGLLHLQPQIRQQLAELDSMPEMPMFEDDSDLDHYLTLLQQKAPRVRH